MNLLIVEDNELMRRMVRSIVADLASAIHECSDGKEALAAYAAHRPDFVLMDIAMAEMDGITATRRIREVDPAARIIIVTDYDENLLREAAQSAGACGYVLKENLLDVRRLLRPTTTQAADGDNNETETPSTDRHRRTTMQVIYATGQRHDFAFAVADTEKNVPAGATVLAVYDVADLTEYHNEILFEALSDAEYYTLRALINETVRTAAARQPARPSVMRGWFNSLSGWLARANHAEAQRLHLT